MAEPNKNKIVISVKTEPLTENEQESLQKLLKDPDKKISGGIPKRHPPKGFADALKRGLISPQDAEKVIASLQEKIK